MERSVGRRVAVAGQASFSLVLFFAAILVAAFQVVFLAMQSWSNLCPPCKAVDECSAIGFMACKASHDLEIKVRVDSTRFLFGPIQEMNWRKLPVKFWKRANKRLVL